MIIYNIKVINLNFWDNEHYINLMDGNWRCKHGWRWKLIEAIKAANETDQRELVGMIIEDV